MCVRKDNCETDQLQKFPSNLLEVPTSTAAASTLFLKNHDRHRFIPSRLCQLFYPLTGVMPIFWNIAETYAVHLNTDLGQNHDDQNKCDETG